MLWPSEILRKLFTLILSSIFEIKVLAGHALQGGFALNKERNKDKEQKL